jgi:hypothetical protein
VAGFEKINKTMKPKECVLTSYGQIPSSLLPDNMAKQLTYIKEVGDPYTIEYECNICKKRLVVTIEDFHVLYTIFPKLPCEE